MVSESLAEVGPLYRMDESIYMTTYNSLTFKIPVESADYEECSDFVVSQCEAIIKGAIEEGRNKIVINQDRWISRQS